jgi:hypothetical protein
MFEGGAIELKDKQDTVCPKHMYEKAIKRPWSFRETIPLNALPVC